MKTKLKLSGLFLAALMLFSLTACGKDSPEPSSTSEARTVQSQARHRKGPSRQSLLWKREVGQRSTPIFGILLTMRQTAGSTKKKNFMMTKPTPILFWSFQMKQENRILSMWRSAFPLKIRDISATTSPAMALMNTIMQSIRLTISRMSAVSTASDRKETIGGLPVCGILAA